jgi:hypothetical protein
MARDTRTCDPALVGPDDRISLGIASNTEQRLMRLEWLRALLTKARIKDEPPNQAHDKTQSKSASNTEKVSTEKLAAPPKPTTSQLLQAAEMRLTEDIIQTDHAAAGALPAAPDHTRERAAMTQVLAGRDFRNLQAPTARDSALEKLSAWLNRLLASIDKLQLHAAWVGRLIVGSFILAVCVGLVLGLMQLERHWRIRLIPESTEPAVGAASTRDWQLWLADARRAATANQWREAIHFVYWAAISHLESKRLWPADRARTPREYLSLVSTNDPRKPQLTTLTGSFERVWYGGHAASESDYREAKTLADALISGTQGGAR